MTAARNLLERFFIESGEDDPDRENDLLTLRSVDA